MRSAWSGIYAGLLMLSRPGRHRACAAATRSQWLPAGEAAHERDRRLSMLLAHARAQVPWYREHAQLPAADPRLAPLDALAAFPLVDKVAITASPEAFRATGVPAHRLLARTTGGSTGTLFHFSVDRASVDRREASDLRGRYWAGWRHGDRQALIWGHRRDLHQFGDLRSRLQNALYFRMLFLNSFELDEAAILDFGARFVAQSPTIVMGYASALALVARLLAARGLRLPPPRGVISAAESLKDEDRAEIESAFGCRVFNRYGSREFGVIAQQCREHAGLHISAERLIVEVVTPAGDACAPGEPGEIVITDLDNLAMPFIRYRTGDLGALAQDPCPCGRPLPALARVLGRTSDILVGNSGRLISCPGPTYFTAGIAGVQQLQILQDARGRITLNVARSPEWRPEAAHALTERLRSMLGDVTVEVQFVEGIPLAASGKYRFCISEATPFRR